MTSSFFYAINFDKFIFSIAKILSELNSFKCNKYNELLVKIKTKILIKRNVFLRIVKPDVKMIDKMV